MYGYRHFSSRIKGGHTNNKIRVSTNETRAVSDDLDILVAFDQETIDVNYHEIHKVVLLLLMQNSTHNAEDTNATLLCCSIYGNCN